jgi:predicted transcriptional regulator
VNSDMSSSELRQLSLSGEGWDHLMEEPTEGIGPKISVLLSIQPQYYQMIKEGTKKYEYRRKFVNAPTTTFLYVGDTAKAIWGRVEFDRPIIDTVESICELAEHQKSGSTAGMREYLAGLEKGYAIPILSLHEIEPVPLGELKEKFPWFTVPQSYILLEKKPELLSFLWARPELISQR